MQKELLSSDRLLDWLEERLTTNEAAAIATQIAQADPETQANLTWLEQFHELKAIMRAPRPPAHVRANLTRQFDHWRAEKAKQERPSSAARPSPSWTQWLQIIKAQLTFDSHAQPALVGVRSAGQMMERQLVYNGRIAEVALNVYPQPSRSEFTLWGQLFPHSEADLFSVQLLQNGVERGLTAADELGEFTFQIMPSGIYDLIISSDLGEIIIINIPLNA